MRTAEEIIKEVDHDIHFYGAGRKYLIEAINNYVKEQSIDFAKFKSTYQSYERQLVKIEQMKVGGIFTWRGESDDKIYEAFLKGEQHDNPLNKKPQ